MEEVSQLVSVLLERPHELSVKRRVVIINYFDISRPVSLSFRSFDLHGRGANWVFGSLRLLTKLLVSHLHLCLYANSHKFAGLAAHLGIDKFLLVNVDCRDHFIGLVMEDTYLLDAYVTDLVVQVGLRIPHFLLNFLSLR